MQTETDINELCFLHCLQGVAARFSCLAAFFHSTTSWKEANQEDHLLERQQIIWWNFTGFFKTIRSNSKCCGSCYIFFYIFFLNYGLYGDTFHCLSVLAEPGGSPPVSQQFICPSSSLFLNVNVCYGIFTLWKILFKM